MVHFAGQTKTEGDANLKSRVPKAIVLYAMLVVLFMTDSLFAFAAAASDYREIAVAVGSKVTFEPKDIDFRSMTFVKEDVPGSDIHGQASYVLFESSTGKRKAEITGKKTGTVAASITYLDSEGNEKKQKLYIYVTDPQFEPLETVFVHGRAYAPVVTGTVGCSNVYLAAQDTSVVKTEYTDSMKQVFVPHGLGAAKVAVVADGRIYIQSVNVINPTISAESLTVGKKETARLEIGGIPPSMKVTYRSSKKKTATVSGDGVVTGKRKGECVITARVYVTDTDVIKLKCKITVGTKKAVQAVREAEAVLGSKYSTQRRMQEGYYDCSSLVWRSYKAAGLPLSDGDYAPVAADIAKKLEKEWTVVAYKYVEPKLLEPGDLIFYKSTSTADRYKSIGHVAMFYGSFCPEGEEGTDVGRIIHANKSVELAEYSSFRTSKIVLILRSRQ